MTHDVKPFQAAVKLINTSASPRYDKMVSNNSIDQMRPMLKSHHSGGLANADKFPGTFFNQLPDENKGTSSPVGYTPSGLQRKAKESSCNVEQGQMSSRSHEKSVSRSELLFDDDEVDASRATSKHAAPRHIPTSQFSPAIHTNSEDLPEVVISILCKIYRHNFLYCGITSN